LFSLRKLIHGSPFSMSDITLSNYYLITLGFFINFCLCEVSLCIGIHHQNITESWNSYIYWIYTSKDCWNIC
jgi:hypothetical protein